MNKREKYTKLCNMICAFIMAALIIMQFVPFWYSVGGEHMTDEQYLEWSEDYIPVAERPTESKAPTTAATTAAPTTEAPTTEAPTTEAPTTEATETTGATEGATEATEGATEATEGATEATEGATEGATEATEAATEGTEETVPEETKKQPKNPFDKPQKKPGKGNAVKPPMPTEIPTDPEVRKISIAESVWRTNRYNKDQAAPLLMFHVVVLGIGAVGIFFCLTKRKANLNCVWILLVAILATLGYFTNPAAQTGMNWMIHGILSAVLLIPGITLLVFSIIDAVRWFTKIED